MLEFDNERYVGTIPSSGGGGGGDTILAINNTGSAITSGDKVFIAPLETPQSGANYELIVPKTTDSLGVGGYTKGGVSIDLTNNYADNFGYDSYLEIPKVFNFSHSWEFNICFKTPNSVGSGWIVIFAGSTGTYENSGLIVQLYQNKITVIITYGDSNDRIVDVNNYSVADDTTYYVRVGWTGTQYYVKYSTDGTNWVDDVDSPITSNVQAVQNCPSMRIGNFNNDSYFSDGKIYLDKTYMISNGELIWQGMYDGTWSNVGSNILTGTASADIASGATGNVTTILGE